MEMSGVNDGVVVYMVVWWCTWWCGGVHGGVVVYGILTTCCSNILKMNSDNRMERRTWYEQGWKCLSFEVYTIQNNTIQ